MEAHKAFEKESKTKAYSKQALAQAATRVGQWGLGVEGGYECGGR